MTRYLLIWKAIQNLVMSWRKMKSAWVKSDLRARAESCHSVLLVIEAVSTKNASAKVDLSVTVVTSCLFSWTSGEEISTSRAVPLAGILKTDWTWSKRTFCFLWSLEIKSLASKEACWLATAFPRAQVPWWGFGHLTRARWGSCVCKMCQGRFVSKTGSAFSQRAG